MCNAKCVIMEINNPFPILDYYSPAYFCDRQKELQTLIKAFKSNRNITLLSIRRMGKTGLIKHLFYHFRSENKKNIRLLYIDLLKTQSLSEFVKAFSNKILQDEQQNENWFKKLSGMLSGLRASVTINDKDGTPALEFGYKTAEENERSLESIFQYLAKQKEKYLIAFDEFQQITSYPETNVEAVLRTHIQHQHKDSFIFSGSGKHVLISMFNDYGRPFYQSSEMVYLERLDVDEYAEFIQEKLKSGNKKMSLSLIKETIKQLDVHTFYVQYFFNKLYERRGTHIKQDDVEELMDNILQEKEYVFFNYRNILTSMQFNLLKAIAKEGKVSSPNSSDFIKRYEFTQASSVNAALKSLSDKEMIYKEYGNYKVYDVFLSKWLERY